MAWPVSDAYALAVAGAHQAVVRVLLQPDTTADQPYPLTDVDGSITIDIDAQSRRAATLTLADPNGTLLDNLDPDLNTFTVERGIQLPTGPEYVPLGTFQGGYEADDQGSGVKVPLSLLDLSGLARARLAMDPVVYPVGADTVATIAGLCGALLPGQPFQADPTLAGTITTSVTVHTGDDRWAVAQSLAQSLSARLYPDQQGTLILAPITPPALVDSLTLPGLAKCKRSPTGTVATSVIVIWENSTSIGRARIDETSSAAYAKLGPIPLVIRNNAITSQAQGNALAAATLAQQGLQETVTFTCTADPSRDVGDVVRIDHRPTRTAGYYEITRLQIPLRGATMSGTGRLVG